MSKTFLQKFNIALWMRQIMAEMNKVTWPKRQEVVIATIMVLVLTAVMSLFFLGIDQLIAALLRIILQ